MSQKLSPPWITFVKKITALFEQDNDVTIDYDDDEKTISINVNDYEKSLAIDKIMPKEKAFGNVTVKIVTKYLKPIRTLLQDYEKAFENNPAFKYVFSFDGGTNELNYVVFKKKVVQFWNDDMSDPHGVTSTLYETIADEVFGTDKGIIFSTDSEKDNKWTQKYFENHATPEEIMQWEYYNGRDSYDSDKGIPGEEEPINVKDKETFKTIFNYNKNLFTEWDENKNTTDEYPF